MSTTNDDGFSLWTNVLFCPLFQASFAFSPTSSTAAAQVGQTNGATLLNMSVTDQPTTTVRQPAGQEGCQPSLPDERAAVRRFQLPGLASSEGFLPNAEWIWTARRAFTPEDETPEGVGSTVSLKGQPQRTFGWAPLKPSQSLIHHSGARGRTRLNAVIRPLT